MIDSISLSDDILSFWFADSLSSAEAARLRSGVWYGSNSDFDDEIRTRFEPTLERAAARELDGWKADPRSALALTIVLDQFPRNLYRGTPRAFELDRLAVEVCVQSLETGHIAKLHPVEAVFALLPLEHSEDLAMQHRSLKEYSALVARAPAELEKTLSDNREYAQQHFDIVERFGRFPHRNAVLGRESTTEELEYLGAGGATFGQ